MQKYKTREIVTVGIAVAINIIGAFVAVTTKVPLLLDHIGTMLICLMFGWRMAVACAFVSSCIVAMLFDPYALPFAPTGMLMIFMLGVFLEHDLVEKLAAPVSMLLIVLPASILGAIIAGYIFGGVTSSGSSIIVRFLINSGLNPALSTFVIQFFMEYFDRLMSFYIAKKIYGRFYIDKIQ
ncbi:MAG: ECF transporter S component [Peptoniphilus sp.]|nr:ECF transporter S component [Peptoniphilus sp.]